MCWGGGGGGGHNYLATVDVDPQSVSYGKVGVCVGGGGGGVRGW